MSPVKIVLFAIVFLPAPLMAAIVEQPAFHQAVAPGWDVYCLKAVRNAIGETQSKNECWIEVQGLSLPRFYSIDAQGEHLGLDRTDPVCEGRHPRAAVNGHQIQTLPIKKQKAALMAGGEFASTRETSWPECTEAIETITLENFVSAHQTLIAAWKALTSR